MIRFKNRMTGVEVSVSPETAALLSKNEWSRVFPVVLPNVPDSVPAQEESLLDIESEPDLIGVVPRSEEETDSAARVIAEEVVKVSEAPPPDSLAAALSEPERPHPVQGSREQWAEYITALGGDPGNLKRADLINLADALV